MNKVLIIDDHLLFADGLKMLLEEHHDIVVETTSNAAGMWGNPEQLNRYSLLVVDLNMPEFSGFNFLQACKTHSIRAAVVVVSGAENKSDIERAIAMGAQAFIPKDATTDELLTGINAVFDGKRYLPEKWQGTINWLANDNQTIERSDLKISARQLEVLDMIRDGLRNKQIATVLGITESAVKSHVEILLRELNVSNRTACVVEGIRLGLIEPAI